MSNTKYAYEKLMAEHNLTVEQLPEDAKVGIKTIKDIEKAMAMAEKQGKKVKPETLAKIKANDKWIVNEILDFVEDTDDNEEEMPHDGEDIVDEIEDGQQQQQPAKPQVDPLGVAIDAELTEMFKTGKRDWSSDEIKNGGYKKTYNCIFDNYEDGQENGVETSNYRLIEVKEELFTLTKK